MSAADIVRANVGALESIHTDEVTAGAGADTTIVADPGDGFKIVVYGGAITINTAGTAQFFHTANGGGNELTGVMTLAAGVYFEVPPMICPESQPLILTMVTGNGRGNVVYGIHKA